MYMYINTLYANHTHIYTHYTYYVYKYGIIYIYMHIHIHLYLICRYPHNTWIAAQAMDRRNGSRRAWAAAMP